MTAGGTRIVERREGGDLLRRVVLAGLGLYLMPAVLAVLLIGGLGMACCAALRLAGVAPRPAGARPRRDGPTRAVRAPHIREVARSRSPHC